MSYKCLFKHFAGCAAGIGVWIAGTRLPADTHSPPSPRLGVTNPNVRPHPDSSLADFSHLLRKPAGRSGFLRVGPNGKFVWADGSRARFWGVNISRKSVFIDRPTIDRVVDVLARAGTNMVRFEALDSTGGLLDIPGSSSSRTLHPERLSQLDYWVSKLKERGIYYYFNLLDFRQFKEGDEVSGWDRIGRAARPYAVFDARLIDLQKEFAAQLLTHRNPFTGLRYVDDPGLALVEICNEHGLFFKAALLDRLVEPYGAGFIQEWNRWLQRRYGSRDRLKQAWGRVFEVDVLGPVENPSDYSVRLPDFTALPGNPGPGVVDARRAQPRLRDGVEFLHDVQRAYFREMRAFLRQIGLRIPVTGVVSNEIVPDVASVAAELDFTSENYYADHPAFEQRDWEGAFFLNDTNPLRSSSSYQVAPWLAALRWRNKPVVVREWATVWPNRFRAIAVPEMAAYASLQDFDAVLLFGYEITGENPRLSDFDHQADPPVWGLYALGAQAFLRGDIRAAPFSATLQHTPETLYRWPSGLTNFHRLSWFVRLNSTVEGDPPVLPDHPTLSRLDSREGKQRPKLSTVAPAITIWPTDSSVLPDLLAYYRAAGAPLDPAMAGSRVQMASTAEITRFEQHGMLKVTTPRTVALCGELPANRTVSLGPFTLKSPTAIGAVMAVSLDGLPLAKSRKYIVKMVSRAENTGQVITAAPVGAPARYAVRAIGRAPIRTFGIPEGTTLLRRGKEEILSLGLTNGSWEVFVRGGSYSLACDTSGIRGTLAGTRLVTGVVATSLAKPASARPAR